VDTVYTAPFLLIQQNGRVIEFDDLRSLARAVRARRLGIAEHHILYHTSQNGYHSTTGCEWIVRDDFGTVLGIAAINSALPPHQRHYRGAYHKEQVHAARLGLPIPGTGKRGARNRTILRRPHCHRALRAHAAMVAEHADIRPKGTIKRPPTDWDDRVRSDASARNWKCQRKTRWK
jgi:hypothetical protein